MIVCVSCFLAVRRLVSVGYNPRPVLDTKIMCTQVFGPSCLTSVEFLCHHKNCRLAWSNKTNRVRTTLKIMMPFSECSHYSKCFLIVQLVACFCERQFPRPPAVGDKMLSSGYSWQRIEEYYTVARRDHSNWRFSAEMAKQWKEICKTRVEGCHILAWAWRHVSQHRFSSVHGVAFTVKMCKAQEEMYRVPTESS
jgi:hypothetical protein